MAAIAPLAIISAVAGTVGAGLSAYGTYESYQAQANSAAYQAQVAANNQIIANQNAAYSVEAGQAQAAATSMAGAAKSAQIKTAQAASGVDVNTGSAADVETSQREENQLNTETVLNNAELQAYGYRAQATSYGAQAGLEELTAQQAQEAGPIAATGSLLSNASAIGMKLGGANSPLQTPSNSSPSSPGYISDTLDLTT